MDDNLIEYQLEKVNVSEIRRKAILNIIEVFDSQGHSGLSASYAIGYINLYLKEGKDSVKKLLKEASSSIGEDPMAIEMQERITDQISEMIDSINKYNLNNDEITMLIKLLRGIPLIPLTGADDEWYDPNFEDTNCQQNRLCGNVFRENYDNSTAVFSNSIIFSDNGGVTWFSNKDSIVPIKFPYNVPYEPKCVYLNGANSKEVVTDKKRIKELEKEYLKRIEEEDEL